MRPDRVREGRRWLEQALRDLDDARFFLLTGGITVPCRGGAIEDDAAAPGEPAAADSTSV
jgi:hypothetical protein